jgi:hypothetical protein
MSSYSDFKKKQEKEKSSGKSSYAKFKEQKNYVPTTFTQRMIGEPVKQKDGIFRATTGFTDVLSGLPLVGAFARLGKTLGETTAYNKLDSKTRDLLATQNKTQDIVPDLKRSNLSVLADTGEAVIDASTGGLSSLFRKGAIQTGKLASRKLLTEADKKLLSPQIMKKFGIETGLNTLGGYSFDVAQNANEGKTGVDALKPGIGTLSAGLLSSVMGGRQASQLQKSNSASRIADKYRQKFNIPEAGTPFDNIKPNLKDNSFTNIPVEKPKITVEPGAKFITPEVKPKSPLELRATKAITQGDFVANEVAFLNKTKQPVTSTTMKQIDKAWSKMHPSPVQEKISNVVSKIEQPITLKLDQPKLETQQNIPTNPEQVVEKVNSDTNWLSKVENKTEENDVRGFKQSSERYAQRLTEDRESLIDYAMGLGDEDPKLPRTSARKLLARDADINNDADLSEKLSFSTVKRESGQELVGNRIFEEQTTADLLEITRRKRANKLGISENQLRAEEGKLFKDITEELNKNVKYTQDDLLDIIKDFLC